VTQFRISGAYDHGVHGRVPQGFYAIAGLPPEMRWFPICAFGLTGKGLTKLEVRTATTEPDARHR
jgi:hypothetical protein